jgi:hypothetical protein
MQLTMLDQPWPDADPDHDLDRLLGDYTPTAIWASVSGGIDSDAAALWARQRWPTVPIVLWHAHLDQLDWPQTSDHLDTLAAALGNATRMTRQAVYERTGGTTPGGFAAVRLRRSHDVDRYGPAADADPAAITTLWDLVAARGNMPPTKKLRYCTSYLKSQLCDHDLRAARALLGARPLLVSGERWSESDQRSRLPRAVWRVPLEATRRHPGGHRVLWVRPVIDQPLHVITRAVLQAGIPLHPGYALQGESLGRMLDPERPERGRARLSCVTCIFSAGHHLQTAYTNAPTVVGPYIQAVQAYEQTSGRSWQQRGSLDITLG